MLAECKTKEPTGDRSRRLLGPDIPQSVPLYTGINSVPGSVLGSIGPALALTEFGV